MFVSTGFLRSQSIQSLKAYLLDRYMVNRTPCSSGNLDVCGVRPSIAPIGLRRRLYMNPLQSIARGRWPGRSWSSLVSIEMSSNSSVPGLICSDRLDPAFPWVREAGDQYLCSKEDPYVNNHSDQKTEAPHLTIS